MGRDFVADGEIVVVGARGFDFAAVLNRTHPAASRVEKLSRETPATFIAFDLVALDGIARARREVWRPIRARPDATAAARLA
jgi:ATP-dependent DNA ligase